MRLKDLELDDADRNFFKPVLSNLRLDLLSNSASSVRSSGHRSTGLVPFDTTSQFLECEILSTLKCGSYHAVVTLRFADDRNWVLKVPAKGYTGRWDGPLAQALDSEAQTMRLIRRETTIPIPEVYALDGSIDNQLGCPFILMEMVPGRSMHYGWYDDESSRAKGRCLQEQT